ncbi:MAG: MAPEG family protein [Alteromonas sp.]
MSDAMIYPVLAMILLTMLVWIYMYYLRIGYSLKHKIHAQKLSTPEKCNTLLPEDVNQPSNNFKNLFEAPVIFYVMTILIIITNSTDSTFVYLGWAYVGLRSIHSLIHCVFNNVMVRFVTYFVSTVLLWVMLIKFALGFV